MNLGSVNQFLEERESHCPQNAILTFLGSDGESFGVDLKREAIASILATNGASRNC